jgi:hypothetical protein
MPGNSRICGGDDKGVMAWGMGHGKKGNRCSVIGNRCCCIGHGAWSMGERGVEDV